MKTSITMSASARRLFARVAPTLVLVGVSIAIGGVAHAYWSSAGAGPGSGVNATTIPVVLTPGTPVANLMPGGATIVKLAVSNPNTLPVRIDAFTLDLTQGTGGFAVDTGHGGCAVNTLSFTTQTNGGGGWLVPAKVGAVNGTLAVTMANALAMGTAAASACQGASFTVYVAA